MSEGCFLRFEVLVFGKHTSSTEESPDEDSESDSEPEESSLFSPLDLVPLVSALVFGVLLVGCEDSILPGLDNSLSSTLLVTQARTLAPASSAASVSMRSSLASPMSLGLVAETSGDSKALVFFFFKAGEVADLSS